MKSISSIISLFSRNVRVSLTNWATLHFLSLANSHQAFMFIAQRKTLPNRIDQLHRHYGSVLITPGKLGGVGTKIKSLPGFGLKKPAAATAAGT
jgi:hypothetical protein